MLYEHEATRAYQAEEFEVAKDYEMHPLAVDKGGIQLADEGNLIPDLVKETVKKVGKNIIRGQFSDLMKVTAPARFHIHYSILQLNAYGACLCGTHL